MPVAGIDIGSRTIALVVLDENGVILEHQVVESGAQPLENARNLIRGNKYRRVVATGYGRHGALQLFATNAVTEIKAHATGAHQLYPGCKTVLDIGGQDSKVIRLDGRGQVLDFLMNDRCAAGTGKFLEIMAAALNLPLQQLVEVASRGKEGVSISSMCTVFAESEVISLLASGKPPADVARAVLNSICDRTGVMLARMGIEPPVVFTGGVASLPGMPEYLVQRLGLPGLLVPPHPQIVGALGAALCGLNESTTPH